MNNTITGTLHLIKQTQVVNEKFSKREFVIKTDEQYPQFVPVEFQQDKCAILDNYREGQRVEVSINIRGREWQAPSGDVKYFCTLQAWQIKAADQPEQQEVTKYQSVNLKDVPTENPNYSESLPF